MRRTNSGALRRPSTGHIGGGDPGLSRHHGVEKSATPRRTLSRITVVPVFMSGPVTPEPSGLERLVSTSAFLRAAPAIEAKNLGKRGVITTDVEVLLLDARHSRPSVVYRAIVRARNAGWERGIVLFLDAPDLPMIPVASWVGATDFVLSSASAEEVEARLRRAAGPAPKVERKAGAPVEGIELHWRTHQISFEGISISLTLREMQLLSVLMERNGAIITADDLSREAWGKGRNTGGALAAAYVCSLRKKLAWFGGRFGIQTVRAVGYRFVM